MKTNDFESELVGKIEDSIGSYVDEYAYNDISQALLALSVKRFIQVAGPVAAIGQLLKIIHFLSTLPTDKTAAQKIN